LKKIKVSLGERSYHVTIGQGTMEQVGDGLKELNAGSKIVVVTNPTVGAIYGEALVKSLGEAGFRAAYAEVPDGEAYKSLEWASRLYDLMLDHGLGRDSTVVALGGGVIGDLAGFAAATYMRGIHFVQVPTTLEAQVDASIGGKVAVNLPRGKNLVGAFHQPAAVFIDLATLRTLPGRELRAGLAEVIKGAIIGDERLFGYLSLNMESILRLDMEALEDIIYASCLMKAKVVEEDEHEGGLRMILNYGHTIGHALEAVTGYGVLRHGEAVAIGMVLSARIANRMGRLDEKPLKAIESLIRSAGLPTAVSGLDASKVIETLWRDKKVRSGKIRFVLPDKIGGVFITDAVSEDMIREVLEREMK
jgi:3-dehydroquinate synthase